jgi:hypothetical protein
VRAVEQLETERTRRTEALTQERARGADALTQEKARSADALERERERATDRLRAARAQASAEPRRLQAPAEPRRLQVPVEPERESGAERGASDVEPLVIRDTANHRVAPTPRSERPINPALSRPNWFWRAIAILVFAGVCVAIWFVLHSTVLH